MARTAFFGSRADNNADENSDVPTEELAATDADTKDRTLEERVSEDRTVPRRIGVDEDRTFAKRIAVDEPERTTVVQRPVVEEPVVARREVVEEPVVPVAPAPEPTPDTVPERVVPQRPARVSLAATLGLLVGVAATAASFTGRLAWVGVAAGVLAILISLAGVVAGARPHVAGRGLGTLGVLFGVAAVAFGVLAMTHTVSWLDSNVDTVTQIRHWFDTQLPFTKSW